MVIAGKGIREFARNRRSLLFSVLFPIVIMVVFRIAFGAADVEAPTRTIAVVDLDTGTGPWSTTEPPWMMYFNEGRPVNVTAEEMFRTDILQNSSSGGEYFINSVLGKAKHEGTDRPMFDIVRYDTADEGWTAVTDREVVALIVVPANFSASLQGLVDKAVVDEVRAHGTSLNYTVPDYGDTAVDLSGELTSFDYSFTASLVTGQLEGYTQAIYLSVRANVGGRLPGGPVSERAGSVMPRQVGIKKTERLDTFDLMLPGVIVFGLMMQAMGVTATMGKEMKDKTLNRLRITKMTSFDLLAGTTIRWMVLGVFQVVLFMAVAMLLGINVGGQLPVTVAAAILIGLVVVLATLSLGLIVSAFIDDPEQATQLAVVIIMPMAFFTGVFFPVDFALAKALPWSQGAEAMKQAMLYASWPDALTHAAITLVEALVLFAIGVLVYSRRRLRN
jgi:ABC-2 type transport system permease protein